MESCTTLEGMVHSIIFQNPDNGYTVLRLVDEDGDPVDIVPRERGEAERIIEDFMILANESVANHTRWLEIPSLYRVHEAPDAERIRDLSRITRILGYVLKGSAESIHPSALQKCLAWFKDQESFPVVSTIMLRSMSKARYDSKCLGHFGLGSEEYTHFTSPIRRYPDLIVHRMLHKYSFNTELDLTKRFNDEILMEEIGMQTSVLERRAVDAERDVEDMKKAEFMEMFVGTVHEGIISGITKFGCFVQLANTVEGLVHVSNTTLQLKALETLSPAIVFPSIAAGSLVMSTVASRILFK